MRKLVSFPTSKEKNDFLVLYQVRHLGHRSKWEQCLVCVPWVGGSANTANCHCDSFCVCRSTVDRQAHLPMRRRYRHAAHSQCSAERLRLLESNSSFWLDTLGRSVTSWLSCGLPVTKHHFLITIFFLINLCFNLTYFQCWFFLFKCVREKIIFQFVFIGKAYV